MTLDVAEFMDIDSSLFYLFSVSLKADEILLESEEYVVGVRINNYIWTNSIEVLGYFLIIVTGYEFYKFERLRTSKVYGVLSLIPSRIIKNSNQMIKNFLLLSNFDQDKPS